MKKKILVYKGKSEYNVLRYATDKICEGFHACGYETDEIDYLEEDAFERFVACLEHFEEYVFYFSIQAMLWNLEQTHIPKLREIKRVGWIVDDPVYHTARLMLSVGEKAKVLMVRDSHALQVREKYPKFDDVQALYHGGFECGYNGTYMEKNIDVFFPGTYVPMKETEQRIKEMEGIFGAIADKVKDRVVGRNLCSAWREEVKKFLEEIHFDITPSEFELLTEKLGLVDKYQRDYMRDQVIEELLTNGITVTVVGSGWDKYDGNGKENLRILSDKGVDIEENIKLMEKSKIVLNNTNITDGLHERILTAMLAKSVCVTNEYALLDSLFKNGEELVTFPLNHLEQLPVIVKELLENPQKAEKIAEAGYRVAKEKHTWQRRGEQIIQWVEDGKVFTY